ncbi:OmpA family protein [Hymenobacter jeollabukensis]|uniref:OmpA family protein n=1 Tax=Hymenobacter jeollabukensis TaxID=2025313 RepID=A0A5R8WWK5_9BACT|nr:OmpA family protein [Hymenobacter jeollabukensis]TLM96535.1 OmpA family protein [Hymenobacter jeollabukensis]
MKPTRLSPSLRYFGGFASLAALLLAAPAQAQQAPSLAGIWQGVETDTDEPGSTWPALMRIQSGKGSSLFGVLYQEAGGRPGVTVTFQVLASRTATGLRLDQVRKLNETGRTPGSYWCEGLITFSYDAQEEKLTGRATYDPVGTCNHGNFTLYRVKLKSAATVPAATATTLRVSGRAVRWYADAELKQPLASGNEYRTRLSKTTTFYITQGYYPTRESAVVPITVKVGGTAPAPKPAAPKPTAPPVAATRPTAQPPLPPLDTAHRRPTPAPTPAPPIVTEQPVALPTVLFKLGTAELLADGLPALNQLAAELHQRPALRLQIAGHTDRVGEPQKNLVLSEQRAEAVKAYLIKAGIDATRLSTIGYGDARPLYPSPDARNRRVEVSEVK